MAKGVILYEGPSQLTGEEIIVIGTWDSGNIKTGNMLQTWILLRDVEPHIAAKEGLDRGVCGDCPHSPTTAKLLDEPPCYVITHNAPLSVWRAYHRGAYGSDISIIPNIPIRFGSYGDPCAAPKRVWTDVKSVHNQEHTGYTHQWRSPRFQEYSGLLMASCDSLIETIRAHNAGWRSFNVHGTRSYRDIQSSPVKVAQCPAAKESKANDKQCASCLACNGRKSASDNRASIKILAH